MRVLHVSHTGLVSGGEHSLLTLLDAMPSDVEVGLACPRGDLAAAALARGVHVHRLPGTAGSLKLHPVHTPVALSQMTVAAGALARLARHTRTTVIHANSIRAGMIAGAARTVGSPPVVTHVRDVLPPGRASLAARSIVARRSHSIVAISGYVQQAFQKELRSTPSITVLDNPVDLRRFASDEDDGRRVRAEFRVPERAPLLGIVGQITPWKGHDTAVKALAELRLSRPSAHLLVVGDVTFSSAATRNDNQRFLLELRQLITELGQDDAVTFAGARTDVPAIMAALDVLLVPSTEEPFGRTVAEGMASGTPVVATSVGGPAELIDDGETGLLVAPGQPRSWAAAVQRLLDGPAERRAMVDRAQRVAEARFSPSQHVAALIELLRAASIDRQTR